MKKISTYFIILFSIFIITIFGFGIFSIDRLINKSIYLADNPIKNDSTFTLEVSYVNGMKEIEEFMLPSDSKFKVTTLNGGYCLIYNYNIGVAWNGRSEKLLKYGVVNFKHITNGEK